ncbi:MAG: aromatic amino acid ammonia-lyase [Roseovarius sp.]|nr:aromatic amino acid ammonia-lyase [Roseovarius sp.]
MSKTLELGRDTVTLEDLAQVARAERRVTLGQKARAEMRPSQEWIAAIADGMDRGEAVQAIYSVNTGFGSLSGREAFATSAQARELSRRLVMSNAAGVGRDMDAEVVRAAMLIRAASLTRGYSGVRAEVVETILAMLDRGVVPVVPEYGSLGASGDLIPLAHMALVMSRGEEESEIDSGRAWHDGQVKSGLAAMRDAGIERLVLGPKEGLALLNGTSFSTAQTALALADARILLDTAEIAAAMSIEALMGFGDAFIPELHEARGQPGQIRSAANIRAALAGSGLIDGGIGRDPERQPPQDAYSLRCVPQVLGPVRDTLDFVQGIVEREIVAATDNPLIFADALPGRRLKAVSGGNFHAEYIAFAADFLSIVVTEIGNIAERRLFRLNDGTLNRGLPDMLVKSDHVGMDCGYMLPQYLAAALVSGLQDARPSRQRRFDPDLLEPGRPRVDGQQRRPARPPDHLQHPQCRRDRNSHGRAGAGASPCRATARRHDPVAGQPRGAGAAAPDRGHRRPAHRPSEPRHRALSPPRGRRRAGALGRSAAGGAGGRDVGTALPV